MRLAIPPLAGLAAALVLAAPAPAAFAPRLSLAVDPPTAGSPVALEVEVTQAASEEATRTLRLALPGYAMAPSLLSRTPCTGVDEAGGSCPPGSRLGSAASTTSFGDFAGGVFYGGLAGEAPRILVYLRNALVPVVLDQKLVGALQPVAGGLELVFGELPGATATRFALELDGGDRALVSAPARCGEHDAVARLVSHRGERHESAAQVAIGGCPGAPRISRLALGRRTLAQDATTTLSFLLSEPAAVRVTARRVGSRRARTLRRLRGRAGRNRVAGIGRGLGPGRWVVSVRATTDEGAAVRSVVLRVVG